MCGSSSRCWTSIDPKYRVPEPKTTGATSIATSSTKPRANACPPTSPAATATVAFPGEFLGLCDRLGHIADEVVRRLTLPGVNGVKPLGAPILGLRPVRHHDHVIPRWRHTLPADGDVEQVAPDHHRPSARPHRLDVAGRRLRDLDLAAVDDFDVAVDIPVEQRADLVLRVGDETVHRNDVVHDHGAHVSYNEAQIRTHRSSAGQSFAAAARIHTPRWAGSSASCTELARSARTASRSTASCSRAENAAMIRSGAPRVGGQPVPQHGNT